jgi:Na+-transporting methylmalonyl-CoA/oxaloacetate decarboxylase gamma subunit
VSEVYSDALVITFVAVGALLLISFFFIALTRGLEWLSRRSVEEKEVEVATPAEAERKKRALIAMAAVTRYMEAERQGAPGRPGGNTEAKLKSIEPEEEK